MTTVSTTHGIPKGVTVRPQGSPKPVRKRSLLDDAADCPNRDLAVSLLVETLGLDPHSHLLTDLSCPDRWRRLPREARLHEIGDWLRAECFERMDFVRTEAPTAVVGTND